jgi:HNH endonuclease
MGSVSLAAGGAPHLLPTSVCSCLLGRRPTRLKHSYGLAALRVGGIERVRLHADLTMLGGYVYVHVGRDDPMANRDGCVLEHRLVMSEAVGRPLKREEDVHHIDEDKANNVLPNLVLFANRATHTAHHAALKRHELLAA